MIISREKSFPLSIICCFCSSVIINVLSFITVKMQFCYIASHILGATKRCLFLWNFQIYRIIPTDMQR